MQEKAGVAGTLATPCRDVVASEFYLSMMRLRRPVSVWENLAIGWSVAKQRNALARTMRGDWLLFIDSDMVFASDALVHVLAHWMQPEHDVIGAVCCSKVPPFGLNVWRHTGGEPEHVTCETLPEGVFEAYAIGLGFTLIQRRVFEKLSPPWFEMGQMGSEDYGEDTYFCKKAREAGFRVWADPTLAVWHVGPYQIRPKRGAPEIRWGEVTWQA